MKKLVVVVLGIFAFSAYGVSQEIKMMKKGVVDPGPFGGGMTDAQRELQALRENTAARAQGAD